MPPPNPASRGLPCGWTRRSVLRALVAGPLIAGCAPRSTLRVGTNVWSGYEPLYVLQEDGALPPGIQLLELVSASQVMRGLRAGLVDVGALTLDEAIRLHAQLGDVVLLAVVDVSDGGDALVGGPNVARIEELSGRKVGCEESALGLYMLARALERGGVRPADVTTLHFPINEQRAAYERGDVDAMVTFEPVLGELVARGARVLFTSHDIPGEVVDVLVTRRATLEHRRTAFAQLTAAWFDARSIVTDSIARGEPRATLRLGEPGPMRRRVYDGIRFPDRTTSDEMIARGSGALLPVSRRIRGVLVELGLARPDTPVEDMFVLEGPGSSP